MKHLKNYYDFICEMTHDIVTTNYVVKLTNTTYEKDKIIFYEFTTIKGNDYSVYFDLTDEDNELLDDGSYLYSHLKTQKIPTIFFSLSSRKFDEKTFDLLTGENEREEVMGKVVYLILEFVKNNPQYNVYSIGEVSPKKLIFYNYYIKHFKDFYIKVGKSKTYKDKNNKKLDCYYLIKKINYEIK